MSVFDIEQLTMLLELEAPFGVEELQLARRKMAKRWHPDIAPAGQQQAHENHLKAINAAADQIESFLAQMRGGRITAATVRTSAEAARRKRAEEGARNYERQQAEANRSSSQQRAHDPFGSRVPDHSAVYRYARCSAYPEWGVGSIIGIYFTGEGDDVQQWGRVSFEIGIRTVPASTLDFIKFGQPDVGKERARRFLVSAQHAMTEGNFELAARRLVSARNADESDPTILRLLTVAYWQSGQAEAAARAARHWARVEPGRPAPHRYAARLYESMALLELAAESTERECAGNPGDGTAWSRLGTLRLRLLQPEPAAIALSRARVLPGFTASSAMDLSIALHLLGSEAQSVDAARTATLIEPEDARAWTQFAIALDRTDALSECIAACKKVLSFGTNEEISLLLARKMRERPKELSEAAA